MGIADRVGQEKTALDQMTWTDAITIGLAQALAVVPGVSRSGITITAARFRHLDREAAARFSFLLSAPAIAAQPQLKTLSICGNKAGCRPTCGCPIWSEFWSAQWSVSS